MRARAGGAQSSARAAHVAQMRAVVTVFVVVFVLVIVVSPSSASAARARPALAPTLYHARVIHSEIFAEKR